MAWADHRKSVCPTGPIGCGPESLCVPQTQSSACERQACHLPHPLRHFDMQQILETLSDSNIVLHSELETQGRVDHSKHVICPQRCAEEEQKPRTLKVRHLRDPVKENSVLVNFFRKLPLHKISVPKGSAQEFDALRMCGEDCDHLAKRRSSHRLHHGRCDHNLGVSLLTGFRLEFSPDSLRSSSVSRAELPPAVPLKRFFRGLIRRADHPRTPSRSRRDATTLGLRKVRRVVPMREEPASVGLLALRLLPAEFHGPSHSRLPTNVLKGGRRYCNTKGRIESPSGMR